MQRNLLRLSLPLAFLATLVLLYFVWIWLGFPSEETLRPTIEKYFERVGFWLALGSGLVEGLFVFGWYFPGTTIIVLCMLAATSAQQFIEVAIAAAAGLFMAYMLNFAVGWYGWHHLLVKCGFGSPITKAQSTLNRYGSAAIFLTYWQFGIASAISTAAGILRMPFARFALVSGSAVALWSSAWAVLIYFAGSAATSLVSIRVLIALALLWLVFSIVTVLLQSRSRV